MFKITSGISPGRTANAEETRHNTGDQRWKSQRSKIHRLAYRFFIVFFIDFSLLGVAYSFLSQIPKFLFGNHKHLPGFSSGFLFVLNLFHDTIE
jgi:hypothetical protein